MIFSLLLPLTALGAAELAASATPPTPTFRREQVAVVEEVPLGDGAYRRIKVLPRYEFVDVWPLRRSEQPEPVLLEMVFRSMEQTNAEGVESSLEVTAWRNRPGAKERYGEQLWSVVDPGDTADFLPFNEYLRTIEAGCCASENVLRLYDVRTGTLAAVSTASPVVVAVPNKDVRRIVAYHSLNGQQPPPEVGDARYNPELPRFLGVLTLTGHPAVERRVAVLEAGPPTENHFPERDGFSPDLVVRIDGHPDEQGNWLMLWPAEENPVPAALGGYQVELTFGSDPPEVVTVPVVADDFALDRATLPPGLRLVRLR
jgi:hypothetical protein